MITPKELSTKRITKATLNAFIAKAKNLFVDQLSSFDGMEDMVTANKNPKISEVSKADAIGHKGVYLVRSSRNSFTFFENENYYGIEVYNCCGCGVLMTEK